LALPLLFPLSLPFPLFPDVEGVVLWVVCSAEVLPLPLEDEAELEDEEELPVVFPVPFVDGVVSLSFVDVFVVPPPAGCAVIAGVLDAVGVSEVVGCDAGADGVVGGAGSAAAGGAAVVAPTLMVESMWLTGAACTDIAAVATWAGATRFATARCACETGTRVPTVE
jgi:hypothetical protein